MAYELQETGKRDCVIISIANYTGKPYDEVMSYAQSFGLNPDRIVSRGTPDTHIALIIARALGRAPIEKHPRRGQEKLTGIAVWRRPQRLKGHCSILMDGHILDTDGKIYTIDEYRLRYGYNLKCVYC